MSDEGFLKRLINLGSIPDQPHSFENKRILLLNKIAVIAIVVVVAIVIVHLLIGNVSQPIVVSTGLIIAIPTLWFQKDRKHLLARIWFLLGLYILISVVFFHSVTLDLDTATEYVLVMLIPMTLIFLDGKASYISTFFVVLSGSAFIAFRQVSLANENLKEWYGLEINWLTISSATFFCVAFFKQSLVSVNKVLEADKKKLTVADENKNLLFGVISHDIRSPLSTLRQYLLLDPEHRQDQEQFMIYQEGLTKKIDEISNTLNDLLYWSKNQLQGIQTKPGKVAIQNIIDGIMPVIRELLRVKKIEFEVSEDSQAAIWCDPDHLSVILRNLIQNAIKFTPSKGVLSVRKFHDKSQIRIIISDSGQGMDTQTLKNLQEGMIVESHLGTAGEIGTGLGLSLVKELVNRNNGSMEIESKVNEGTKVILTFPLAT